MSRFTSRQLKKQAPPTFPCKVLYARDPDTFFYAADEQTTTDLRELLNVWNLPLNANDDVVSTTRLYSVYDDNDFAHDVTPHETLVNDLDDCSQSKPANL